MTRPRYLDTWRPSAAQAALVFDAFAAFGFGPLETGGKSRADGLCRARQAAAWALRTRWPKLSYPMIARLLGRNDHSTALHAVRRGEKWRAEDAQFRAVTDALVAGLPVPEIEREAVTRAAARLTQRDEPAVSSRHEPRQVRARNDFSGDDPGAIARRTASDAYLAALRREHPERFERDRAA